MVTAQLQQYHSNGTAVVGTAQLQHGHSYRTTAMQVGGC
uniref:Uncharacterized protein n=1 Tax=Anguilla anguilla TaxID=7936 RepID=A0A0E9QTK3_ANGAN